MARIKYYYDTDTCKFEKSTLTWKSAFRKGLSYLFMGGVVSIGVIAAIFYFYDSPEEKALKRDNEDLMTQIDVMGSQLAGLETEINELHDLDSAVYRTILNADPIPATVWDAGTGGSVTSEPGLEAGKVDSLRMDIKQIASQVEIHRKSLFSAMERAEDNKKKLQHTPSIRPLKGELISGYGRRKHPILGIMKLHTGLDFRAKIGTPVYATADGVVKYSGVKQNGYGTHIDINHGFGYQTKYAHLSKIYVHPGQTVKRGDLIGLTGNTGLSKGPHLHYEIISNAKKINPIDYFYNDLDPETYVEFKKMASQENESMD